MNSRAMAVLRKELRDFRRNKFIVATMIALPLFVLFVPFSSVLGLKEGTAQSVVRATLGSAGLVFFLVPLILPTVIAGYSVIGEREQGTLEPVLTTPVREAELLIGKALSAVIPCVAISYLLFGIYLAVVHSSAAPVVRQLVVQSSQIVAVILFVPLLALFSIWVGLAISVRSNDVRVAQQLSGLAVFPMLGLIALFTFRVISPTVTVALSGAVLLAVLDAVAWRVVSAMFDRERILTRYGSS